MNPQEKNTGTTINLEENTDDISNFDTLEKTDSKNIQMRKKKKIKIFIVTGIVLVSIPLIGFLLLYLSFSGGVSGIILNMKTEPDANSAKITTKREEVKDTIDGAFRFTDSLGFKLYATSTHDKCYKGQNNWKVHNGYAYRCDYRITKYYGFDGEFKPQMQTFDQTIKLASWEEVGSSMENVLTNYYDKYYGDEKTPPYNFREGYFVSSMPMPGYEKDGMRVELRLAEKRTTDIFGIRYAQNISGSTLDSTYEKRDFQSDVRSLLQEITNKNTYLMTISIQKNYFQN